MNLMEHVTIILFIVVAASLLFDFLNGFHDAANTISTIVRGLEEKGFVGHEQFGNTYRYMAIISREEFSKNTLKNMVGKYFNQSYASVVSMFVEEENISLEEIRELIQQAKNAKNQGHE